MAGTPSPSRTSSEASSPASGASGSPPPSTRSALPADGPVVAQHPRPLHQEAHRVLVGEPAGGARDERPHPLRPDVEEARVPGRPSATCARRPPGSRSLRTSRGTQPAACTASTKISAPAGGAAGRHGGERHPQAAPELHGADREQPRAAGQLSVEDRQPLLLRAEEGAPPGSSRSRGRTARPPAARASRWRETRRRGGGCGRRDARGSRAPPPGCRSWCWWSEPRPPGRADELGDARPQAGPPLDRRSHRRAAPPREVVDGLQDRLPDGPDGGETPAWFR